jgi:CDP-diacylglycerol--glycerol-3-phosphate 3-phosphatidyltransferase
MPEIDLDVIPGFETKRARAFVGAVAEQGRGGQNVATAGLAARDPLELAQLLQRVDPDVRIGADADPDRTRTDPLDRKEAVAEVRLRRRARADARSGAREQVELVAVRMRGMDDRRALAQTTCAVEELDRPDTVLREALLDLARLLVCVHVQREAFLGRVAPELLKPVLRAGPDGVGGEADGNPATAQLLHLPEVRRYRFLAKARQAAALVRREEHDDPDLRLLGCLDGHERLLEPEVVEFAHGRVAGPPQLTVDLDVLSTNKFWGLALRLGQHQLPPGPEVPAAGPPPQGALEGVAVGIDESREAEALGHGRILSTPMATRAVPAPLQQLPNALTIGRLALIPVFVALMLSAEGGHSWPAGIVFGVAGVTDQIDGFLARRWRVESQFGRIFDPLADRLMIDAAVILLFVADHMPWAGLALIVGRDLILLAGYKAIAPQGYELNVNLLGKTATWLLYTGIGFLLVTHRSTDWPYWIFWTGLVLAFLAAVVYAVSAWKEIRG